MTQIGPTVCIKVKLFDSDARICAQCGGPLPANVPVFLELIDPPAPGMLYMPACPECVERTENAHRARG